MASGNVWRVQLDMKWGTVVCRPGFHLVEGAGGPFVDLAQNVATAVNDALGATPLAGFSDQLTLSAMVIEDIQPGTLPTKRVSGGVFTGDIEDLNPLPPQSAGVISLHTALKPVFGAFAAAGRIYMPGIPQVGQISGFLQSSFQDALANFADKLLAAFVDDGTAYQWHVVSYTPGSKPRTVRAINPVVNYSINNVVRSQRRREYGVGI